MYICICKCIYVQKKSYSSSTLILFMLHSSFLSYFFFCISFRPLNIRKGRCEAPLSERYVLGHFRVIFVLKKAYLIFSLNVSISQQKFPENEPKHTLSISCLTTSFPISQICIFQSENCPKITRFDILALRNETLQA